MTARLDVFVHATGVVELRSKHFLPPHDQPRFVEVVPPTERYVPGVEIEPKALALKQRVWLKQEPPIHGVFIWKEY